MHFPIHFRPLILLLAVFFLGALALALSMVDAKIPSSLKPPKCEDASTVDAEQARQLRELVKPLVASPFFGIFHVAVDSPCPFWRDDAGKCAMRECAVGNCEENEVPAMWRTADAVSASERAEGGGDTLPEGGTSQARTPFCMPSSASGDVLHDIDRTHSDQTGPTMRNWAPPSSAEDWTVHEDGKGVEKIYVDLRKNPERYTGFKGPEAHRIWDAIYAENCLAVSASCSGGLCAPGTCKEERVFYRLVSGVHTSITMHIAKGFLHGSTWGHNLDIFRNRVRANEEYVKNLYMTLAVVLRAVAKVAPSLDPAVFPFKTGDEKDDAETSVRVRKLLAHPLVAHGCDELLFNESDMFVANARERLPEFRGAFRNISMIMDCVGCEKCRLWGKLQFLGLGTSLRILFSEVDEYELKRNEVIALFNFLNKLLSSVAWHDELTVELERQTAVYTLAGRLGGMAVFLFFCLLLGGQAGNPKTGQQDASTAKARQSKQDSAQGREEEVDSSGDVVKHAAGACCTDCRAVPPPPTRRRRVATTE